jgi:hypothetical protein
MGVRDYHDASTDFKYPGSMEAGGNISGTFLARENKGSTYEQNDYFDTSWSGVTGLVCR